MPMPEDRHQYESPPPKGGRDREGGQTNQSPRRWADETALKRGRHLRRDMTDAERTLWFRLRGRRLEGYRFRKQVPLGHYVADFACMAPRLVVEVDGGQHASQIERDETRTEWLQSQGFKVLRFWNHEVSENLDGVLLTIVDALRELDDE